MTLGVVTNDVVNFPSVMQSLPFDMPGDLTPFAVCGRTPVVPLVPVVNPKVPDTDAKAFVAPLKAGSRPARGAMPCFRAERARCAALVKTAGVEAQ